MSDLEKEIHPATYGWAEETYFEVLAHYFEGLYIDLINRTVSVEDTVRKMIFDGKNVHKN
jgi:hypothetical protein